jgi:hypothetical protein
VFSQTQLGAVGPKPQAGQGACTHVKQCEENHTKKFTVFVLKIDKTQHPQALKPSYKKHTNTYKYIQAPIK